MDWITYKQIKEASITGLKGGSEWQAYIYSSLSHVRTSNKWL